MNGYTINGDTLTVENLSSIQVVNMDLICWSVYCLVGGEGMG